MERVSACLQHNTNSIATECLLEVENVRVVEGGKKKKLQVAAPAIFSLFEIMFEAFKIEAKLREHDTVLYIHTYTHTHI